MAKTESTMLKLGSKVPKFNLKNFDGSFVEIDQYKNKSLFIMFICNHCPFVKHLEHKLAELGNLYLQKGVGVIAINSNDPVDYPEDSPEKMKEKVKELGYKFPYLFDSDQEIAKKFQAACTPDFYIFDKNHELVYRGQFDDSRPGNNIPVTGKNIIEALDALIIGKKINSDQKPSLGCNIKWKSGNEPNYYLKK